MSTIGREHGSKIQLDGGPCTKYQKSDQKHIFAYLFKDAVYHKIHRSHIRFMHFILAWLFPVFFLHDKNRMHPNARSRFHMCQRERKKCKRKNLHDNKIALK